MIKIEMEFKKGILFVRLNGSLTKLNNYKFRNEIFPIILKHEFKYVVLNFEKLNSIDQKGIESLYDLNNIINSFKGRISICNINNKELEEAVYNTELKDYYYQTNNELTAIGVFKI